MELEDYLQPEIAVTAAVAAAIFSPRVRKLLRRGAVYGTAGVLIAGDTITSFVRNVGQGFRQAGMEAAQGAVQQTQQSTGGQP
jgi:hypothetical protein